ncbi:MAG: PEGA domain-containing protein [Pseudomonadota bacterium]
MGKRSIYNLFNGPRLLVLWLLILLITGWHPGRACSATDQQPQTYQQALAMLDRGEFAAAAGRFDQARDLWNQALKIRPGWAKAKARLAELPQRRGRFAGEEALRTQRVAARLACVEAITAFNQGDYGRAVRLWAGAATVLSEDTQVRERLEQARRLEKAMGQGSLRVECAQKAVVRLDGQVMGETPLDLAGVAVGEHRVEVEAFGGRDAKDVSIKPRTASAVRLTVLGGGLVVKCTPRAQIVLDGRPVGQTPLELLNLALGPHRLELRAQGHATQVREVLLRAREKPQLELTLVPR